LHVKEKDFNDADRLLRQLHRVPRAEGEALPGRPEWVSAETWRLVDQRALGRRTGVLARRQLQIINSAIRRSMRRDRKHWMEAAGAAIQAALEADDLRGLGNYSRDGTATLRGVLQNHPNWTCAK
jgi:hypothetical protein